MSNFEEEFENKDWTEEEEESVQEDGEAIHPGIQEAADLAASALTAFERSLKNSRKRKRRRKKANPFLIMLIVILLLVGFVLVLNSPLFAIKRIVVEGNRYYSPAQIIEMSGIESGKNLYFELKTRTARNNLLKTPYIKVATIERVPMSTVKIVVEERLEYAAISADGGFVIIDKEGMVLRIAEEAPHITILEGIGVDEPVEGKAVKVKEPYLFSETLRLMDANEAQDLVFMKIYFSVAIVRVYLGDSYYFEGAPENILKSLPAIKELVMQHLNQGINKGVIKVGTDGYLSFSPKID